MLDYKQVAKFSLAYRIRDREEETESVLGKRWIVWAGVRWGESMRLRLFVMSTEGEDSGQHGTDTNCHTSLGNIDQTFEIFLIPS